MLPSNEAVEAVYLDPKTGVFAGLEASSTRTAKLVIECGTIASATIMSVAEAAKKYSHISFVDAPVSGGPMGSEAGTLSFMVGCPPTLFACVKELLVHMGKEESIFLCGDIGTGTAFKLINNYISIISILSVSEAYNIGSRLGLDLDVLTKLFNSSTAQCWLTSNNKPVPGIHPNAPASNGYQGGFRVELAKKVLELGKEWAESAGAETTLDKTAIEVFRKVTEDPRYKGRDARVVYQYLSDQ